MTLFRPARPPPEPLISLRPAGEIVPRSLIAAAGDALPSTIYGFILRHSLREQIYLVVVTLLSFICIIRLNCQRSSSTRQAGRTFLTILGIEFSRISYLVLLAFFSGLVLTGLVQVSPERAQCAASACWPPALRSLRAAVAPDAPLDRTAAGEIIAMLTAELEPVAVLSATPSRCWIAVSTLLTIFVFCS
jgi:hypothetical protein